jgi:hypothetical protein
MALKVHGMLETTGLNSASARLQHASLPAFGNQARSWDDEEESQIATTATSTLGACTAVEENFEEGVVSVESELLCDEDAFGDDGYDLLPLPVLAPERKILSEGSDISAPNCSENRFHYGNGSSFNFNLDDDKYGNGFLCDASVDVNIDKLREVIGSVDNTLSRCLASSGGIGKAQKERQAIHLDVVRGLDSFAGMRGKFVSQRSLMKGVAGIGQSKDIYEEGDVSMIDGKRDP